MLSESLKEPILPGNFLSMGTEKKRKSEKFSEILESKLYIVRTSEGELADISCCGLRKVPPGFYNLCRVFRKEILDLHSNELSSLSASDKEEDLLKMDSILREINASKNLLRIFPKSLLSIRSLTAIDLSENQINEIPNEIDVLYNLQRLNLKSNRLRAIPATIGKLKNLRELDISLNMVRQLPVEISHLDNLQELLMDIERMEFPPADVCKRDLTSLKRYLMDLSLCDDHPLDSDTVSDECDRIASEEHPDSIQTINANNPIQYPDKETAVDEPIPFDVEERDRERRMRFEELAKEQEELDFLVEKVFAQRLRDSQSIADAVAQCKLLTLMNRINLTVNYPIVESHAQGIIENALNMLINSNTVSRDVDEDELDAVLCKRRAELQREHEEWLKTTEEESAILSEFLCNEAEERRQKSMEEIARRVAEVDVLILSKCEVERKKFEKLCAEIMADQNVLEDLIISMRERADERSRMLQSQIDLIEKALIDISVIEIKRKKDQNSSNARQLEEERLSLSRLYEQYMAERDFRRKQLFMQMRADIEKEQDSQRRIAAECLRRYAEMIAPPESCGSPQRRSASGAERFGHFMALFGRKKKLSRTHSSRKTVDSSAIKRKGSLPSDSMILTASTSNNPSNRGIVKARYEEECVVCLNMPVKVVISPCGHVCLCEQCATTL
uniref:E3 ubiquitin-protein ligase LRSAM1 n=1 Tax=Ascaris lumbricoides TaxID=6252 RepID=A0A0M3HUI8_ASCLU